MPVPDPQDLIQPGRRPALSVLGIPVFQKLDLVIGGLVMLFFLGSSLLSGGDTPRSLLGAVGIMIIMFLVGLAIEVMIESLRDVRGLGTIVGFITNGPEALCLIVGLLAGDILFAASTPLGSNFMNPLMLLAAALITGSAGAILAGYRARVLTVGLVTAVLAGVFFLLPPGWYPAWVAVTLVATGVLFRWRPPEPVEEVTGAVDVRRWVLAPAILLLVGAGYLLDPVVEFTAVASRAPKGLIGFLVLASLTSWPEFKSCIVLFRRRRAMAGVLNILVSNLTNLWLATAGVIVHLLVR